jgi:uncharacterized protein YdhG (YjbR/CyaY superfamily)
LKFTLFFDDHNMTKRLDKSNSARVRPKSLTTKKTTKTKTALPQLGKKTTTTTKTLSSSSLPFSVTQYYASAPSPHRETMLEIRSRILSIVPEAKEKMSYSMPAFENEGIIVAGLLANKKHVGYYPFSGGILELFPNEIAKYKHTKSALHVPVDQPMDLSLLRLLIEARMKEKSHK